MKQRNKIRDREEFINELFDALIPLDELCGKTVALDQLIKEVFLIQKGTWTLYFPNAGYSEEKGTGI